MLSLGGVHVSFRERILNFQGVLGWLLGLLLCWLLHRRLSIGVCLCLSFVIVGSSKVPTWRSSKYQAQCYHTWNGNLNIKLCGFFELVNQDLNFPLGWSFMSSSYISMVLSIYKYHLFQLFSCESWLISSHGRFWCLVLKPLDFYDFNGCETVKILQNPSLNRDLEQNCFSSDEIHLTYIKNKFGRLANTWQILQLTKNACFNYKQRRVPKAGVGSF